MLECSVSEFVALLNQTLDIAFQDIMIYGELANFRVSRNQWVYFDLKDDEAIVKFFGTVYQLPGPLEEGMILKVYGQPRLHPKYGFSVSIRNIQLAGEGSIRRSAELLKATLEKQGLFDVTRKRILPYPPTTIGLITAKGSAAYADFSKIIQARWRGLTIQVIDSLVQGERAPAQLVAAIEYFNVQAQLPDVLVIIRGGGSAEDLAAFNTEQVTRAIAASRAPTLVAIGHESDISLAELAADVRASTPSNAAELLTPDRQQSLSLMSTISEQLYQVEKNIVRYRREDVKSVKQELHKQMQQVLLSAKTGIEHKSNVLGFLNPQAVLRRGYAIVRRSGKLIHHASELKSGDIVETQLQDGKFKSSIE